MIRISGVFTIALSQQRRYNGGTIIIYDAFNIDSTSQRKTFLKLKQFVPAVVGNGIAPSPLPNGATRFFIGSFQQDGYMKDGEWIDLGVVMMVDSICQLSKQGDESRAVAYEYQQSGRNLFDMVYSDAHKAAVIADETA